MKTLLISILTLTLFIMTGCSAPVAEEVTEETTNIEVEAIEEEAPAETEAEQEVAETEVEQAEPTEEVMDEEEEESEDAEAVAGTFAIINTSEGTIKAELYPSKVPETVKNFVELSNAGKYNGVIFHRVISNFMIQTGDFENMNGTGGHSYKGPGTMFADEFDDSLTHTYGALSMANRGPATNGSQFFIVQAADGTSWLDGKHSVFGHVIEGMDVVEAIAAVEKGAGDKPVVDITIDSITIQ